MGVVNSGIPKDIVTRLAELSGAKTFVETGTFQGATTRWAAEWFETVHTIELAKSLYDQCHAALAELPGVHPHWGNSAELLPEIVQGLSDAPALFWLDGHWSGGETAGEAHECPLLAELQCLQQRPQDLILIDDARLFLAAPPKPHKPEHWPGIAEIVSLFEIDASFIQVIEDVIFIVPNTNLIKQSLIDYAQSCSLAGTPSPKAPRFKRIASRWLGA